MHRSIQQTNLIINRDEPLVLPSLNTVKTSAGCTLIPQAEARSLPDLYVHGPISPEQVHTWLIT